MHYNIVIETCEVEPGTYRADVVEGPQWAVGWCSADKTREGAAHALRRDLQWERPRDTFDFLQVRS